MNPETVGKKIAELRKAQGLTQKDLAAMLHVTDKAVSKWERGINFPDLTLMEPLAAALHTTTIELLSLEYASNHEVAETLSTLSIKEKENLVKELRRRSILKILIELFLFADLIIVSFILSDQGLFGLPQIMTMGVSPLLGALIGSELFSITHTKKLK